MGILITEHVTGPLIKYGWVRWLVIVAVVVPVIAVDSIVVGRRRLRHVVGGRWVALMVVLVIIILSKVVVFRVVWEWPQLGLSSCFSNCFENLTLICPACDCHLLHFYIYVDVINSWNTSKIAENINNKVYSTRIFTCCTNKRKHKTYNQERE